ncbi:MAG: hypothetical protein MJ174_00360 [Treponema sp.]|nr:hypothetical protein [Treponema sp.]
MGKIYVIECVITKVQKCLCGCKFWLSGTEGFSVNINNQNKNSVKYNLLIENNDFNLSENPNYTSKILSCECSFNSSRLDLVLLSKAMMAGKKCQIIFSEPDGFLDFDTSNLTIQSITICSE